MWQGFKVSVQVVQVSNKENQVGGGKLVRPLPEYKYAQHLENKYHFGQFLHFSLFPFASRNKEVPGVLRGYFGSPMGFRDRLKLV